MLLSTTVIVFAVSSVVFLSIGYACGWFSHKQKQLHASQSVVPDPANENLRHNEQSQLPQPPEPLIYEEVQLDLVELEGNVAYGPIARAK